MYTARGFAHTDARGGQMATTREVRRSGAKGGAGGEDAGGAVTGLEDAMRQLAIRHFGYRGVLLGRERDEFMQENDPLYFDPFKRFYREKARQERRRQRREREGSEEVALQLVPRANAAVEEGPQEAGAGLGAGGAGVAGDDEPPPPNEPWRHAQRYDLGPYEAALEARRVELGRTTRQPRGATDPLRLIRGKMSKELSLGVLRAARVYLVQEQGHVTWKGLRFLENVLKKEIVDPETHLEDDLHRYPDAPLPADPEDAVYEPLREHCEDPLAWLDAYEAMARVVFTRGERELFTHLVSEYVARFSESLVQRAVDLRGKLTTKQKRYITSTGRVVWVDADDDASDSDPWDDEEAGFDDDDDERRSLASAGDSDNDSDSDGEGAAGGLARAGDAATTVFDRVEAVNLRRMLRTELENYLHRAPDDYSAWYRAEAERLREARLKHVERVWRHARKQLEQQLEGGAGARDPVLQAFVAMDEPDDGGVGPDARHAVLWSMFEAAEQEDVDESNARLNRILFPPKPARATREAVRRAQRGLGVIGDDDDDIDASVGLADASIGEQVAVWLAEELESYYHRAADDYSPRYRAKVEKLRRRWVQDNVDEFAARVEGPLSEAEIAEQVREFEREWGHMTGADGSVVLFPPKPAANTPAATLAHELREGQARLNAGVADKRAARARQRAQMQAQLRREIRGHVTRLVQEGKSMEEVVAAVEALWKEKQFAPRLEAEARRAMVRQAAEALDSEFRRKQLRGEQRRMRALREERRGLYSGLRLQHGLSAHRRPGVPAGSAVPWDELLPRARRVAAGALAARRPTQAETLARSRELKAQIHDLQARLQTTERPPARNATEESFREMMRAYTPRKRRLSEKVYSLMRDELDVRNMQAMKAHMDGFIVPAAWENAVAGAAAAGRGASQRPRVVQMCVSVQDPPLLDARVQRATPGRGVGGARGKRAVRGGGGGGEAYWRSVFDDGDGPVPAFVSDAGAGPSRPGGGV